MINDDPPQGRGVPAAPRGCVPASLPIARGVGGDPHVGDLTPSSHSTPDAACDLTADFGRALQRSSEGENNPHAELMGHNRTQHRAVAHRYGSSRREHPVRTPTRRSQRATHATQNPANTSPTEA